MKALGTWAGTDAVVLGQTEPREILKTDLASYNLSYQLMHSFLGGNYGVQNLIVGALREKRCGAGSVMGSLHSVISFNPHGNT